LEFVEILGCPSNLGSFQPLFLQIFLLPSSLEIPIMHILVGLMVSHASVRFCSFSSFQCLIFEFVDSFFLLKFTAEFL
jgi:hypothetical protein